MATIKPRINITMQPHRYDLLKRLAGLQGVSMSSLIAELLDEFYPMLERVCVVLEAAEKAQQTSKEGLKKAVEMAEVEMVPLMKATMSQFDLFIDRVAGSVTVESLPQQSEKKSPSGRKSAVLNPRVVTRGSGSDCHIQEKQVSPSIGKGLKEKSRRGTPR